MFQPLQCCGKFSVHVHTHEYTYMNTHGESEEVAPPLSSMADAMLAISG